MDDTLFCPICKIKLRNVKRNGFLHSIGKSGDYIERTCSKGMNHRGLQLFGNQETGQVDLLRLPLHPQYSRHLEIDFYNQRCRISCRKDGQVEYIEIEKMLHPDFPDLVELKNRVALYITFS